MSLFDIREMNEEPADHAQASNNDTFFITDFTEIVPTVFSRNKTLIESMPALEPGCNYAFWSDGKWHLHELLFHILGFTGPAELHIATWSIKELPMRLMVQAKAEGLITGIDCLVDKRVKYQNPDVWAMGNLNFDRLAEGSVHAKVTVIRNEQHTVSIVTSANYTNNPRQEGGTIYTSAKVAQFYIDMITKSLEVQAC
jgi:hypothetical protein